jgi:hypothetical protein
MLFPHMLGELVPARISSTIARTANDWAAMDSLIDAMNWSLVTCLLVFAFECHRTPRDGAADGTADWSRIGMHSLSLRNLLRDWHDYIGRTPWKFEAGQGWSLSRETGVVRIDKILDDKIRHIVNSIWLITDGEERQSIIQPEWWVGGCIPRDIRIIVHNGLHWKSNLWRQACLVCGWGAWFIWIIMPDVVRMGLIGSYAAPIVEGNRVLVLYSLLQIREVFKVVGLINRPIVER